MNINIGNLSVKPDPSTAARGYYIVDLSDTHGEYLTKHGTKTMNALPDSCWWPTRKEAMDFVIDLNSGRISELEIIETIKSTFMGIANLTDEDGVISICNEALSEMEKVFPTTTTNTK